MEMRFFNTRGGLEWDEIAYGDIILASFLVNLFLQMYGDIGKRCHWCGGLEKCGIFTHLLMVCLEIFPVYLLHTSIAWALVGKELIRLPESGDALKASSLCGKIGSWLELPIIFLLVVNLFYSCHLMWIFIANFLASIYDILVHVPIF